MPAGDYLVPDGQAYVVPAFCRLRGAARPSAGSHIRFQIWMPVEQWNGRYHQVANGGLPGIISYVDLAAGVGQGYAVGNSDDGHTTDLI